MSEVIRGRVAALASDAVLFVLGCISGTIAVAFLAFFVALCARIAVFMWSLFF